MSNKIKILRMSPEAVEYIFGFFKLTPELIATKLSELCGEPVTARVLDKWTGECPLHEGEEDIDCHIDINGNITLKVKTCPQT